MVNCNHSLSIPRLAKHTIYPRATAGKRVTRAQGMQEGKVTETPGRGAGHGRGSSGWQTAGCRKRRARRKVRTEQEVVLLPFLSLCICHSGVSENDTKLPNRVPGNADVETPGRKATGKLREPGRLGQARAEAGKGPGAAGRSRPGTWTVTPASRCPTADAGHQGPQRPR